MKTLIYFILAIVPIFAFNSCEKPYEQEEKEEQKTTDKDDSALGSDDLEYGGDTDDGDDGFKWVIQLT